MHACEVVTRTLLKCKWSMQIHDNMALVYIFDLLLLAIMFRKSVIFRLTLRTLIEFYWNVWNICIIVFVLQVWVVICISLKRIHHLVDIVNNIWHLCLFLGHSYVCGFWIFHELLTIVGYMIWRITLHRKYVIIVVC